MKKIGTYFLIFMLSIVVFLFGFNHNTGKYPNTYYNVYLDDELIGTINSKDELEDYINTQADTIRSNINDYTKKVDAYNTFNKVVNNNNLGISNKLSTAQNILDSNYELSDIDIENINNYISMEIYNISDYDINTMKDYIENNNVYKYADEVYTPNGINIEKIYTYNSEISTVQEIYKKIIAIKSCTISGYKFTIESDEDNNIIIYTLDKKIFTDAIDKLINIFVDSKDYEKYKNNTQSEIVGVGEKIENIYVEQNITYKAENISTNEKIYTNAVDLSAYLLYGDDFEEKEVIVDEGESIETIAYNNQISVEEFLIFNPKYNDRDNLIAPGTSVIISTIDPKINIVVETYEVVDKETSYSIVEKYDDSLTQGSIITTQDGENGMERVSQSVKTVNGIISYVEPEGKEVIKASVPKIITIGTKYIPNVGSLNSWGLPVNSGYTISSYFGYRQYIYGSNWHSGVDFAGTGYGSPIYATNNGVIETMTYSYSYGNYIIINHNNGYYSVYGHMSGFASGVSVGSTVSRGQTIGYVGSTGNSTGPHLHFEIRVCEHFSCAVNPLKYLR